MTLYQLLKEISSILTPEDDAFYEYALYTSDDNGGFLRTRYCRWEDRPIRDMELGEDFGTVLVTSKHEISTDDLYDRSETRVKMQITYSIKNATVENADWDTQLGYCYVYLFDLRDHTYLVTYIPDPCG